MSGFLAKVGLLNAGVEVGTPLAWLLVVGGIATSLLTLYALSKVWSQAFWRPLGEARFNAQPLDFQSWCVGHSPSVAKRSQLAQSTGRELASISV